MTTTASRGNPFFLTVALSAGGWARGDLFWDDGDGLDTFEMENYCYIIFIAGEVGKIGQIFALGKLMRQCFTCCTALMMDSKISLLNDTIMFQCLPASCCK